jgi:hypothetical protein
VIILFQKTAAPESAQASSVLPTRRQIDKEERHATQISNRVDKKTTKKSIPDSKRHLLTEASVSEPGNRKAEQEPITSKNAPQFKESPNVGPNILIKKDIEDDDDFQSNDDIVKEESKRYTDTDKSDTLRTDGFQDKVDGDELHTTHYRKEVVENNGKQYAVNNVNQIATLSADEPEDNADEPDGDSLPRSKLQDDKAEKEDIADEYGTVKSPTGSIKEHKNDEVGKMDSDSISVGFKMLFPVIYLCNL